MPRRARSAPTVLAALALSGCATLFSGTEQNVYISSEPAGAIIIIDGLERGTTPTTLRLDKPGIDDTEVTLRLPGYADRTFTLQSEFDMISLVNVLFWPGFLVDALSGAIKEYDPTTYTLEMQPSRAELAASLGVDHLVLEGELPRDAEGKRVIPEGAEGLRIGVVDPVSLQAVVFR